MKRIYRSRKERILGGVCGGMGEYLNVDPVILRLLFVLLVFAGGAGVILYIVAWMIIPEGSAGAEKAPSFPTGEKSTDAVVEGFVREVEEVAEQVEKRLEQAVERLEKKGASTAPQRVIGILLILTGIFLFLAKFVDLSWIWVFFWPLLLVVLGLLLLLSAWRAESRHATKKL